LQKADFSAQNAPKSFVAGARQVPLRELTVLRHTPWLYLRVLLLREEKDGREEMLNIFYGKFLATLLLSASIFVFALM